MVFSLTLGKDQKYTKGLQQVVAPGRGEHAGAYLGGAWCHAPLPLGRQDSILSIEWYAKVWHAPLCNFGTKFEHRNGQNLTYDFFFGL